ncbi:hypothetical protein CK203_028382 [Vitis vinifera]|uniref:Mitochondrial protein n=1 Tax=Vitis vinifera TaxID=29760 RepID=A0A438IZZ1_VITVI|nr:hypothetical protein CK203_028382 [Vitis vinifera]
MMEDSPCESFEPLDLPHVSPHGDEEPESFKSITLESPNFTTEPVSSPFQPVSLAIFYNFLRCIQGKRSFQNISRSKNPTQTLGMKSRKGTKECTNRPLYPLSHYVSLKHLSPTHKNLIVSLNTTIISNTVSEALTKREWKDAMREEMNALEKNKTWEIVERPKGKNIVDCKWIFTLK